MRWLFAACAALMMTMNVFAEVDYKLVTQQNITDAREIQVLREELFLGGETIERAVIADLLNDGFDQNDAVVLYPTGRVLRLEPISERLDSLLRSFKLPANAELYEGRQYFTVFDSVSFSSRGGKALGYGLLGGLQERLARGYRGDEIEGYFKFTNTAAQIRLWNFDSTRVSFPRPTPSSFDTLRVFIHDTVFVPEIVTVVQDPIVIRDTVYIRANSWKNRAGCFIVKRSACWAAAIRCRSAKRRAADSHLLRATNGNSACGTDGLPDGRKSVHASVSDSLPGWRHGKRIRFLQDS